MMTNASVSCMRWPDGYGFARKAYTAQGLSRVVIDHFTEDRVAWNASDFRFTQKGNTLYAFQMRWPEDHRAVIRSLTPADQVKSVRLLGAGEVPFERQRFIPASIVPFSSFNVR
ncbi:alpha-L-fucosidase C-terminal domain-containing protein [Paenibacillus amylolyticus]|uniref:alpha-L-fucosidase C-terminal domain-containing protein n=1 Tax=Paenibacillus amylolyticus TaxID=1451 RepID=UPI003D97183B